MTDVHSCSYYCDRTECIKAQRDELRERLAQPEQESVATVQCVNGITIGYLEVMQPVGTKLYTSPPQRKPLTDEEIEREWQFLYDEEGNPPDHHDFARAIEAAHGIKGEA